VKCVTPIIRSFKFENHYLLGLTPLVLLLNIVIALMQGKHSKNQTFSG